MNVQDIFIFIDEYWLGLCTGVFLLVYVVFVIIVVCEKHKNKPKSLDELFRETEEFEREYETKYYPSNKGRG